MNDTWADPKMDEQLIELYRAGKTLQHIREVMGLTRGAVGGRITRLVKYGRVERREPPERVPYVRKPKLAAPKRPTSLVTQAQRTPKEYLVPAPPEVLVEPTGPGVGLEALRYGVCRFPLWTKERPTPDVARYCGCKTTGLVYCPYHMKLTTTVAIRNRPNTSHVRHL